MTQSRPNRLYLFFVATYLAQGMVGIAYEPISYLQKEVLALDAARSAAFTLVMTLPFLIKPLLGLLSDAVPLGGLRRRPYVLVSSACASAAWAALALMPGYSYRPVLFLLTAANLGIAFSDVLCDAVMVESGKKTGSTGLFQAAQIGTLYATLLATGLGGGWLAEHASYRAAFALTALFPALIFAASLTLEEAPARSPSSPAGRGAPALWSLLRSRGFWALAGIILLFNFTPFQGTSMFYFQTDTLGFSKLFIGILTSIGGVCGVAGAALFWRCYGRTVRLFGVSARLDTAALLRLSVVLGVPLTLLYLAYRNQAAALLLTALAGAAGVFMRLSLMDEAAKRCPAGGEAACFALFMALFNAAAMASNTLGGHLYAALAPVSGSRSAMSSLVLIGALASLAAFALSRILPVRDPEMEEAFPAGTVSAQGGPLP